MYLVKYCKQQGFKFFVKVLLCKSPKMYVKNMIQCGPKCSPNLINIWQMFGSHMFGVKCLVYKKIRCKFWSKFWSKTSAPEIWFRSIPKVFFILASCFNSIFFEKYELIICKCSVVCFPYGLWILSKQKTLVLALGLANSW